MNNVKKLRNQVLDELGGKCVVCGWDEVRACLHVDHVNEDGAEEREKLKGVAYWRNIVENIGSGRYQILCANHNFAKAYEYSRTHKRKKRERTNRPPKPLTPKQLWAADVAKVRDEIFAAVPTTLSEIFAKDYGVEEKNAKIRGAMSELEFKFRIVVREGKVLHGPFERG